MIADVLGVFLDSLTEREFDGPFLAILRSLGFHDTHFLHGPFEFGKDFIAKRTDSNGTTQYSFQTKSGDLGISEWRTARGQIDEMRTSNLAHPNFDTTLSRRSVFVTTGRLVGGAGPSAQEYERHLEELGESSFEVWDRDTIVEVLAERPEIGLSGTLDTPLMSLLAEIAAGEVTWSSVEKYSRRWVLDGYQPWQAPIAAAVIANRCRETNRLDLAALTALLLVRSAAWHAHRAPGAADELLDHAGELFGVYVGLLAEQIEDRLEDPDLYLGAGQELAIWATYPARCIRTAELLALNTLRLQRSDTNAADAFGDMTVRLVATQPGCAHPISDEWAASLIPIALVLGGRSPSLFGSWTTEVTRWVADHYDTGEGLAGLGASPAEELNYLAGSPFEHINLRRRKTSLIATAVLDSVSVLEHGQLYDIVFNEFLAVDALPAVVEVPDNEDQYVRDGPTITHQANPAYDEPWNASDWRSAAHHRRCPDAYQLVAQARAWEHLGLTAVLRDRWFVSTMRTFV